MRFQKVSLFFGFSFGCVSLSSTNCIFLFEKSLNQSEEHGFQHVIDLPELQKLAKSKNADEFIVVDAEGRPIEAAYACIVWWTPQGVLTVLPDEVPVLESVVSIFQNFSGPMLC